MTEFNKATGYSTTHKKSAIDQATLDKNNDNILLEDYKRMYVEFLFTHPVSHWRDHPIWAGMSVKNLRRSTGLPKKVAKYYLTHNPEAFDMNQHGKDLLRLTPTNITGKRPGYNNLRNKNNSNTPVPKKPPAVVPKPMKTEELTVPVPQVPTVNLKARKTSKYDKVASKSVDLIDIQEFPADMGVDDDFMVYSNYEGENFYSSSNYIVPEYQRVPHKKPQFGRGMRDYSFEDSFFTAGFKSRATLELNGRDLLFHSVMGRKQGCGRFCYNKFTRDKDFKVDYDPLLSEIYSILPVGYLFAVRRSYNELEIFNHSSLNFDMPRLLKSKFLVFELNPEPHIYIGIKLSMRCVQKFSPVEIHETFRFRDYTPLGAKTTACVKCVPQEPALHTTYRISMNDAAALKADIDKATTNPDRYLTPANDSEIQTLVAVMSMQANGLWRHIVLGVNPFPAYSANLQLMAAFRRLTSDLVSPIPIKTNYVYERDSSNDIVYPNDAIARVADKSEWKTNSFGVSTKLSKGKDKSIYYKAPSYIGFDIPQPIIEDAKKILMAAGFMNCVCPKLNPAHPFFLDLALTCYYPSGQSILNVTHYPTFSYESKMLVFSDSKTDGKSCKLGVEDGFLVIGSGLVPRGAYTNMVKIQPLVSGRHTIVMAGPLDSTSPNNNNANNATPDSNDTLAEEEKMDDFRKAVNEFSDENIGEFRTSTTTTPTTYLDTIQKHLLEVLVSLKTKIKNYSKKPGFLGRLAKVANKFLNLVICLINGKGYSSEILINLGLSILALFTSRSHDDLIDLEKKVNTIKVACDLCDVETNDVMKHGKEVCCRKCYGKSTMCEEPGCDREFAFVFGRRRCDVHFDGEVPEVHEFPIETPPPPATCFEKIAHRALAALETEIEPPGIEVVGVPIAAVMEATDLPAIVDGRLVAEDGYSPWVLQVCDEESGMKIAPGLVESFKIGLRNQLATLTPSFDKPVGDERSGMAWSYTYVEDYDLPEGDPRIDKSATLLDRHNGMIEYSVFTAMVYITGIKTVTRVRQVTRHRCFINRSLYEALFAKYVQGYQNESYQCKDILTSMSKDQLTTRFPCTSMVRADTVNFTFIKIHEYINSSFNRAVKNKNISLLGKMIE